MAEELTLKTMWTKEGFEDGYEKGFKEGYDKGVSDAKTIKPKRSKANQ